METLLLFFNWQVLLLVSPTILVIAFFCFLLWWDNRYYDRKSRLRE